MSTCTYCGDVATGLDHVVPWSWNHSERRSGGRAGDAGCGQKVPACTDCNTGILGDKPLFTVEARTKFVMDVLAKRVKRLKIVRWTEDELDELGKTGTLRTLVEAGIRSQKLLCDRFSYAKSRYQAANAPKTDAEAIAA